MSKKPWMNAELKDGKLKVKFGVENRTENVTYEDINNMSFSVQRSTIKECMPDGETVYMKPGKKTQIMLTFEIDHDLKDVEDAKKGKK